MSAPNDNRFDAALSRYLAWEADQLRGAPSAEEVIARIAAQPAVRPALLHGILTPRPLLVIASMLLLAALVGALAVLSGRLPFPSVIPRNGEIVVALDPCTLGLLDSASGATRAVAPAPASCGPTLGRSSRQVWSTAWSADGARLAYAMVGCFGCEPEMQEQAGRFSGAWLLDLRTGIPERVLPCPDPAACFGQVAISPDGSRVAYTSWHDHTGAGYLTIVNADGSDPVAVEVGPFPQSPTFSPDGDQVAFSTRLEETPTAVLHVVNSDGSHLSTLLEVDRIDIDRLRWSPASDQILFRTWSYETEGTTVSVISSDGSGLTDVFAPDRDTRLESPSWSYDGSRITYATIPRLERPGTQQDQVFWSMAADGSDQVQVFTADCCVEFVWSPDGRTIAWVEPQLLTPSDDDGLFLVNTDGSGFRQITVTDYAPLSWQPIR